MLNGLWEEEPKKKKKKKKKHQEDQDPEPVFHGSDSSGYQSDHTKKKKEMIKGIFFEIMPICKIHHLDLTATF